MKKIKVFQIRLKVFLLKDLAVNEMLSAEAEFIDSALAKSEKWLAYHEENQFKGYTFGGLYPVSTDKQYKKESLYTITIRCVNDELARYLSNELPNHYTDVFKGLVVENKIIPQKFIEEIYTLTPAIVKNENGYWRNNITMDEFERLLFENAVKKYNHFTEDKIDEDFQLYTSISFSNKKPISCQYKNIHLLGDKLCLKIADDKRAQDVAYMLLGTGLCELGARGYGFCNYKWL